MPPKAKSQWDFGGELFPEEAMRRVLSVTEMTGTVRRLLEQNVGTVWVTGEVSNLRAQGSGHIYFSLKDANAQLSCVCFRDDARGSRQLLADGRKVVLKGDVTVYEARGQYQLIVTAVELEGLGALQVAFEKLKQRLAQEGLFAPERKKPIPSRIHRIGIVSSPTGAAIRDVLHVIERRHPGLEIVFAGCRVQGQGAADEIARAVRLLNEFACTRASLDAILVTRGGGSLEDLWAFNEEVVARAIFASRVPVVSAVGHEIDFTISDFVADLRAATPSAAAELLTEGMWRCREWVEQSAEALHRHVAQILGGHREHLDWLISRLARAHPRRQLNERAQRLDDLQSSLFRCTRQAVRRQQERALSLSQRLARLRPSREVALRRQAFEELSQRLAESARHAVTTKARRLEIAETRLRLLSPQHVLERGFSITRDKTGKVLRDATEAAPDTELHTKLAQGSVVSVVKRQAAEPDE
jgi:exodeoxyribonuclease VII large subunit